MLARAGLSFNESNLRVCVWDILLQLTLLIDDYYFRSRNSSRQCVLMSSD